MDNHCTQNQQNPISPPKLCSNCATFYGSAEQNYLCSSCFKFKLYLICRERRQDNVIETNKSEIKSTTFHLDPTLQINTVTGEVKEKIQELVHFHSYSRSSTQKDVSNAIRKLEFQASNANVDHSSVPITGFQKFIHALEITKKKGRRYWPRLIQK